MKYKSSIIIITFFLLLTVLIVKYYTYDQKDTVYAFSYKNASKDAIKDELVIALFMDDIKAVEDTYYKDYFKEKLEIFNYEIQVQDISKNNGLIHIKFGITPVYGPHWPVGYDEASFAVDVFGKITFEDFQHLKSYELPEWYNDIIIKPLPKTD